MDKINMSSIYLILLCLGYVCGYGRHMPSYIKACSKSNIATCPLESARAAYPFVVKGDPEYDIPNLSPFKLSNFEVDAGENLELKFHELTVEGLEHLKINKVEFDLDKKTADFELYGEVLNFMGAYEGGGKVYVVTLHGKGDSNITFAGATFTYYFSWDIKNINGEDHLVLKDPKVTMKLTKAYYYFENLTGKDNAGDDVDVNKVLNDHWELIMEETGDKISSTIEGVVSGILKGYFEHIPVNEMFLS